MSGAVFVLGATSLIGRFLPAHLAGYAVLGSGRGEGAAGYDRWVKLDLTGTSADLLSPMMAERPDGGAGAGGSASGSQTHRAAPPSTLGDVMPAPPSPTLPPSRGTGDTRLTTIVSLAPIWLLPKALPGLIQARARRVVAFSSTSRWTKAQSPDAGEREVAGRLAQAEAETIRICEAAGVAWTLLRPTLIYAEGRDGNVSRLASLARRFGALPISGRGEGRRQPVHADDLAAAVAQVLASEATRNRAYDLPGGETLTYAQMCRRVFDGLGRRPRLLHVPPPLWSLGLRLASPLLPGATAAMGARMAEDLVFDPEPARHGFGWRPRDFRPDFLQPS